MLVNWGRLLILAIVGSAAKHCIDQCMISFRYCLLGGDTAMLGGIPARLCYAFLVKPKLNNIPNRTRFNTSQRPT